MCGIFGIVNYGGNKTAKQLDEIKDIISMLLESSEQRGRDASGVCLISKDKIRMYKNHVRGGKLVNDEGYKKLMSEINVSNNFRYMFGHTRSKTKGSEEFNINNHPIRIGKVIGVHNGMISNDDALFSMDKSLNREGQVDSEIIFQLLNKYMEAKMGIVDAIKKTAMALTGWYHCAFIHTDNVRYLNLFNGSEITIINNRSRSIMAFASSVFILNRALLNFELFKEKAIPVEIEHKEACRIDTTNGKVFLFDTETTQDYSNGPDFYC